tara:strand:+ start:18670 stop:18948 length:279 start_codon:yes stop_codon:yes gene_type:complete
MIKSFKTKQTQTLFERNTVVKFKAIERQALRRLSYLNAATSLDDLKLPPSNRFEKLKGDKKDYYSLRVNRQWRVCFRWQDGHAYEVEIVDYH